MAKLGGEFFQSIADRMKKGNQRSESQPHAIVTGREYLNLVDPTHDNLALGSSIIDNGRLDSLRYVSRDDHGILIPGPWLSAEEQEKYAGQGNVIFLAPHVKES